MADEALTDEQLAMVLQASRDFALDQMARGDRLLPFATRVPPQGEIAFARYANEDTQESLDTIYTMTQKATAAEVAQGDLVGAALVATVKLDPPIKGDEHAIRVHLETKGRCLEVLAPFSISEPGQADGDGNSKRELSLGEMVTNRAEAVLFTT